MTWQDAILALYREAERQRDAGQKRKALVFAEAACFLETHNQVARDVARARVVEAGRQEHKREEDK